MYDTQRLHLLVNEEAAISIDLRYQSLCLKRRIQDKISRRHAVSGIRVCVVSFHNLATDYIVKVISIIMYSDAVLHR